MWQAFVAFNIFLLDNARLETEKHRDSGACQKL